MRLILSSNRYPTTYQIETAPGLEDISQQELKRLLGKSLHILNRQRDGEVDFLYEGQQSDLKRLRTAYAAYEALHFDIPRPKALLGHQHFERLVAHIESMLDHYPAGTFQTLYVNAAGSETRVMQRIRTQLASRIRLIDSATDGDLLLRIRPEPQGHGWQVLIRLTPRPLATRKWRVIDMPGALNAPVAHAMAFLSQPEPENRCLNIACGSGTILIERATLGPARTLIGCDIDGAALQAAKTNITSAATTQPITLLRADATHLPFEDGTFDTLLADLPFGQHIGSHNDNVTLYPAVLAEAGRIAAPGARFVVITHEIKLMQRVISDTKLWQSTEERKMTLRGLHPRIFVLRRR